MKPIPIRAAKELAETYGYSQVIIIAVGDNGDEHVTTYGAGKPNCDVAARIGQFLSLPPGRLYGIRAKS
jgi:hypothetical protein